MLAKPYGRPACMTDLYTRTGSKFCVHIGVRTSPTRRETFTNDAECNNDHNAPPFKYITLWLNHSSEGKTYNLVTGGTLQTMQWPLQRIVVT